MDQKYPNNVDKRPKRRKDKDNPYEIFTVGVHTDKPHYYISFTDGQGVKICMEIEKKLFDIFDQSELDDLSFLNEYDRHYEQSDQSEANLEHRATAHAEALDEMVIRRLRYENLHNAIALLPKVQRRRLILYYFSGLSYERIAELEGCSLQAVGKSVKAAEEKLRKLLKEG